MRPRPLPGELGSAFRSRDASALGVTRSRLRARDLERPFRGVYERRSDEVDGANPEADIERRARVAALHFEDRAFFSHTTATVLWGLPLPVGVLDDVLDVGVIHPARPPRVPGVRGHRVPDGYATVRIHPASGLQVVSPASAWAMMGAVLRHPYDLVAVGDALISDCRPGFPPPLATESQMRSVIAVGRRVGIDALRQALPRVRTRVASRTETWTRLTLVDALLPEPMTNHHVFDARGGFIACVDLAYPELKIAIEYEGEQHLLDPVQWAKDIERYEHLAADGWYVVRVTKDALFRSPESLVARVRHAIKARS